MQFRFLYLDADGVETKVTTVEELAAKIRAGAVGEHTVLYDALTREWGPAGVHGTWRMIRDDLDREEHVTTNPRAGIPPATRLTLAPDFLDDEGSVAAFVAARERERRDEAQRRGSDLEFPRVMREDSVLEVPAEPLPASGEPLSEPPSDRTAPAGAGATAGPEDVRSPSLAPGKRDEPPRGPTRAPARRRRRILRRGAAAALSAAGLLILWAWAGAGGPADAGAAGAGEAGVGGAPPPVND
ncbi:MAG TPA: hypothetical protein RMF84_20270, partial [Polyangiaceae bacterium LLY-WYZ-14_1]|nr:hypothetical protein [Polyangiaceae bacterium LLY-WYZ-14_1]